MTGTTAIAIELWCSTTSAAVHAMDAAIQQTVAARDKRLAGLTPFMSP